MTINISSKNSRPPSPFSDREEEANSSQLSILPRDLSTMASRVSWQDQEVSDDTVVETVRETFRRFASPLFQGEKNINRFDEDQNFLRYDFTSLSHSDYIRSVSKISHLYDSTGSSIASFEKATHEGKPLGCFASICLCKHREQCEDDYEEIMSDYPGEKHPLPIDVKSDWETKFSRTFNSASYLKETQKRRRQQLTGMQKVADEWNRTGKFFKVFVPSVQFRIEELKQLPEFVACTDVIYLSYKTVPSVLRLGDGQIGKVLFLPASSHKLMMKSREQLAHENRSIFSRAWGSLPSLPQESRMIQETPPTPSTPPEVFLQQADREEEEEEGSESQPSVLPRDLSTIKSQVSWQLKEEISDDTVKDTVREASRDFARPTDTKEINIDRLDKNKYFLRYEFPSFSHSDYTRSTSNISHLYYSTGACTESFERATHERSPLGCFATIYLKKHREQSEDDYKEIMREFPGEKYPLPTNAKSNWKTRFSRMFNSAAYLEKSIERRHQQLDGLQKIADEWNRTEKFFKVFVPSVQFRIKRLKQLPEFVACTDVIYLSYKSLTPVLKSGSGESKEVLPLLPSLHKLQMAARKRETNKNQPLLSKARDTSSPNLPQGSYLNRGMPPLSSTPPEISSQQAERKEDEGVDFFS